MGAVLYFCLAPMAAVSLLKYGCCFFAVPEATTGALGAAGKSATDKKAGSVEREIASHEKNTIAF